MLALIALLLAAATPGAALPPGSPVVSIDRPAQADAILAEASLRLRAELAASGYDSRIVSCDVDPLAGPADCPRDETVASISLARAADATSIFVSSKLKSGLELRRQVRVRNDDGGSDATLLAVRAVELLRDLQVTVATAAAVDSEDPRPLEPFAQPGAPGAPPRWHLVAGGTTLMIPWSHRSLTPAFGGLIGVGRRYGQHVLAIIQALGPFGAALPIAQQTGTPVLADRHLYQAIAGLSVRFGRVSGVEGLFGVAFAGASYMHLNLNATNLLGLTGQTLSPMIAIGVGYTLRVTKSFSLTAELDLDDTDDVRVAPKDEHDPLLTETGFVWVALNLTATIPLF